jgi:hypothetical protein
LRDVTVLGVDERLRQPLEVCVDLQHPWIHRPIAIPEGSGAPLRRRHQSGHAPEVPRGATSGVLEMSRVEALATPARCPRTTCTHRVEGPEQAIRNRRYAQHRPTSHSH